jgi:hypothetical protein
MRLKTFSEGNEGEHEHLDCVELQEGYVEVEGQVVPMSNTVIDPWAVMVITVHTSVADRTMS